MSIDIISVLIAGIISSIVWFFVGALVYMNPAVAKIYKKYEDSPSVKNRKNVKMFLLNTFFLSILFQCLIFSFVYAYILPILPGTLLLNTFYFGMLLVSVKIIPRFFDMYVQSQYPTPLLIIEIINGTIGSFVIAFVLVIFI